MVTLQQLKVFFFKFYLVAPAVYQIVIILVEQVTRLVDVVGRAVYHNLVHSSLFLHYEVLAIFD